MLLLTFIFVIFAFNVIDAETLAYLGVPVGVLILSGISGLLGRWLSGRLYPGLMIAGIAMLVLSLAVFGWASLAIAGDVV